MRPRRRSPGLPPPPPGGFRRDDRRYNNGPPRRRHRSPSPPDRFRRHSPPFKRGRFGRDDEPDFRYGREPFDRRDRGGYFRRPPSPPPRQREGPRPYKDFIKTLHDDVTPEEAQSEYQVYLAEFWGSEVRADFEAKRNETWMKEQYDPREMQKATERRNLTAQAAAKAFAEDLKAGLLDPKGDDFNQGEGVKDKADAGDSEDKAAEDDDDDGNDEDEEGKEKPAKPAEPEVVVAHEVCWKPERVAGDLALSRDLILKLDAEKGITQNDLVGQPAEKAAEETAEGHKAEEAEKGPQENGASKEAEKGDDAKAEGAANGGEEGEAMGEAFEAKVGKLDLQLTYLWRVHALDYYGGKELANPASFEQRSSLARVLRGPHPEEGEQAPEAEEKKGLKQVEKKVTIVWKKRLVSGDPFEAALQKERVEKHVDEWVEAQVKHIDENKWGSTQSTKLFVGKDYVLKHIRLKHTAAVDAEREKIYEDLYWENYKKAREEQKRLQTEAAAKMQQAAGAAWAGGLPMPQGGPMGAPLDGFGAGGGSFGPDFGGPGPMGPGMASVHGPPIPPPRRAGPPIIPGGAMPAAGLVFVPAPGAGPMGPFIQVPISEAGQYGGRQGAPMRGSRPRHPGYGGPPMGFMGPPPGAKVDPRGVREYYDLDNPTNNRAVLDYGDL